MKEYEQLKESYNNFVKHEGISPDFDKIKELYDAMKEAMIDFYVTDPFLGKKERTNQIYGEEMRIYRLPLSLFAISDLAVNDIYGGKSLPIQVAYGLRILSENEGWNCGFTHSDGVDFIDFRLPVRVLDNFILERKQENGIGRKK